MRGQSCYHVVWICYTIEKRPKPTGDCVRKQKSISTRNTQEIANEEPTRTGAGRPVTVQVLPLQRETLRQGGRAEAYLQQREPQEKERGMLQLERRFLQAGEGLPVSAQHVFSLPPGILTARRRRREAQGPDPKRAAWRGVRQGGLSNWDTCSIIMLSCRTRSVIYS